MPRFAFDGPSEPLSGMPELARFDFGDFEGALDARATVWARGHGNRNPAKDLGFWV